MPLVWLNQLPINIETFGNRGKISEAKLIELLEHILITP